jgi:hypothetical protein
MSGEAEPDRLLVVEWAVCAIAAAAARFIPVPLLDDAVKQRATRIAIVLTLRAHGRHYPSDAVQPLYAGVDGWASGALGYLKSVPRRVALFPVRKYVALFGSVKGVPTDVMQVLLLARTTHRCLAQGRLAGEDPKALRAEALLIRRSFDTAVEGMDLRLLTGALADGLSHGMGLKAAAVDYALHAFGREHADPSQDAGGLDPGGPVGQGAERVEEVLRRPEIAELLTELDARFDANLAAQG